MIRMKKITLSYNLFFYLLKIKKIKTKNIHKNHSSIWQFDLFSRIVGLFYRLFIG